VTVVLGAAGGVGTSFVACNLAHALATEANAATLLMDLDFNDAPLAGFLDLVPERGLVPAIAEAEFLDEHALQGYVTRHHSGLHLMGAPSPQLVLAKDLDPKRFTALLDVVATEYRHVVVDASHDLDEVRLAALGAARTVVLVLQQSVVQVKQAARLLRVLSTDAGVADERVLVVVNRHVKRATVGLEDVRRALARSRLVSLPNQYQSVLASVDGGVPALELDRSSPVARGIVDLQKEIVGAPRAERASLLRRALPMFSGD
jgi:pilus assembly protein CpaE